MALFGKKAETEEVAKLQAHQLVNAHCFIALLLIDDEIRDKYAEELKGFILQERPNYSTASSFSEYVFKVLGEMANQVSSGQSGILYVNSHLWNYGRNEQP